MKSVNMSFSELVIKLPIVMLLVAFCILTLALTGFWLDYYKFHTLPILTAIGAITGTALGFILTWSVIRYGHKKKEGQNE